MISDEEWDKLKQSEKEFIENYDLEHFRKLMQKYDESLKDDKEM